MTDVFASLDELRKSVDQENKACETWKDAETALSQALCAKRDSAKAAVKEARLTGSITSGLAKHGENVKLRKWRTIGKESNPQASPPLQRASSTAEKVLATASSGKLLTAADLDHSFLGDMSRGFESDTWSRGDEISARVIAKQHAVGNRAKQIQERREAALEHTSEHGRRKLRSKIADVLLEVRRRQELHAQQERAKKFRDKRFSRGVGPQSTLGDLPSESLGVTVSGDLSPRKSALLRRTALLDSLTLNEFNMLRKSPEWFFSGPAIAAAANSATQSLQGTHQSPHANNSSNECVFYDLANFFAPTHEDNQLDAAQYVQKLRNKNAIVDSGSQFAFTVEESEYRKSLRQNAESRSEENPVIDDAPPPPLELMPCCGRHPQIRDDGKSPTLIKIREVSTKKKEQDERFLEDRRKAIEDKGAIKASKAGEQQHEHLLEVWKQKELHKVKMLQAEEKKALMEAERHQRTEMQNIKKINQVMAASEKAEEVKESRRNQVQASLEKWHEGVARASQRIRREEIEKRREGQRSHKKYMERLDAIGASRQLISTTQAQKNDELKAGIHTSLSLEIAEQQHRDRIARAEASKKKQEDAALRRQKAKWGYRYCFSERAFGVNAGDYDAKHHMVAVDRRGDSWKRIATDWAKVERTFSMPDIPSARSLSPGGELETWAQTSMEPMESPTRSPTSALAKSETTFFLT